ncbi:PQQ-dependent dehydrogenase, methanol/ethanol family [Altererythrobacter sp. Root672]|uniref:PQQ-dependent dehydrogenase, methanol/ethanol family n=1 Tax=Altererythrobacter sp. Root672 TaxID=1736584 RepID=UPI0006F55D5C|nr:PQQ-dependent dehydrogenase, methanol/ethanol family [Altererythrobacter sp. Root672]KRA81343.1 quinohemoprotein alcohol dehydrogenase [Altererythrobacter sp. Root672]
MRAQLVRQAIGLALGLGLIAAVLPVAAQESGPARVDHARLLDADRNAGQWMSNGRTYDEQRFSPLTQINAGNVNQLGLAWYADIATTRGMEATPLAIDGVLYNVQPWNIVTAYDAKTGRVLWAYDPHVPLKYGRMACCDIVSRGLAAWKGKIYVGTLDGRLIALDARTGKPVWSELTVDNSKSYTITGAPRVFDGKVLIGNGGAELGVRGYVTAYDAETGKQLWRFYTVPGDPAAGFENAAMEMAAKTWTGEWWKAGGGGTVWDNISYDPKLKLIYIGTGNGSPWVRKWRSPGGGDNLFLASIVALKADTGEYVWHYQTTPGEEWDYTATQQMILADLPIGGRTRKVLMQAPKNGFFYVLDRETGELISAKTYVPINWASGVDMATGRPVENPAARYGIVPTMVSPGAGGGHNWNPMAFSPMTGLVYIPVSETYMAYAAAESFDPARPSLGTSFSGHDAQRKTIAEYADAHSRGWLSAWDPVTQREVWRVPSPQKGSGGVLVTAGNLVFEGTIGTTFAAYRADTGEKVWEMPVQQVPISAPITYMVDGEQYVAVNAGWGGGLAHVERSAYSQLFLSKPRLLVFKLGGKATLPPLPAESVEVPELSAPPALTGSPELVARGEQLYGANCALCHGNAARGGVKDLRHMTPATHAEFLSIVIGGQRAANGMASFADVLSRDEAEAIHHYLIARANEDWGH